MGVTGMRELARELRKEMPDAEARLWYHLRAHRFHGYKFRRQVVIEPYIVDFVCVDAKLIVEADGGQHVERKAADDERTPCLERLGYVVLRFWNDEILNDTETVLARIYAALIHSPLPNPSP